MLRPDDTPEEFNGAVDRLVKGTVEAALRYWRDDPRDNGRIMLQWLRDTVEAALQERSETK